jgi:hypothetical protein
MQPSVLLCHIIHKIFSSECNFRLVTTADAYIKLDALLAKDKTGTDHD